MSKPTIINPPPPVAQRPKCGNCHEPLKPFMHNEQERRDLPTSPVADHRLQASGGYTYVTIRKTWTGNYHAYGNFCTLRCCEAFANAMYKRGVRR